ncbi:hypothetical protein AWB82_05906 [Caballeronia glebae]|uniref:Uncharacterized protein n=1 Tax=Caballeronia glebae TaxID=1777143 RepID=A0A158CWB7_9BURK|nr:hypothetical protein [Caballeronia glebae]SAK86655.1 hypothetical protein AWB82_05906 [Caballeronia glebae]
MDCVDQVSTGSLLPASGGWHCRSMQGFIMLMAHGRTARATTHPAGGRGTAKSWCESLSTDVAMAFELQTGYATSAIALPAAVDGKLELARFLSANGSAAAVLVMDAQVLSRVWPLCDWKTPLLRVRNRLADEGSKFFVALTTRHEKGDVTATIARLRDGLIALRVQRYCEREGIGFLGAVLTIPPLAATHRSGPLQERVGTVIAHRLASTTFFCCDAFRTGAAGGNTLSEMRG